MRLKRELAATSAQDQFAKWAKLQRQYDKALAEHDKKCMLGFPSMRTLIGYKADRDLTTAQSLQTFKTSFESTVSVIRWLSTNGLRFFLQFWYAKQPIFWLPRGWVPGYVEWALALPRAQTGSISIQVWGIACASVIQIVSAALVSAWALVLQQKSAQPSKGEPMKMGANTGGGQANPGAGNEKKEL